jgi:uncharacterized protein YbjT (DUF2867 family)
LSEKKILVIGGTGYVGVRLVQTLLEIGYKVRITYRSESKLGSKLWVNHPNLEKFKVDALERKSLLKACISCTDVYYLLHSMLPDQSDYQTLDIKAAENMVYASNNSSLKHIIYLGGLGGNLGKSSKHLKSRALVGEILRTGNVPVTILQAAMIIGSGSASFEILRYVVERLPLMVTPKWIYTKNQPVAIRNVIEYLIVCLSETTVIGKTFDIGGPQIVTYRKLMEIYAEEAFLQKRRVISLPFNDPFQSSAMFLDRIVPVHTNILKPLVESLRYEAICKSNGIQKVLHQDLLSPREAIRRSIQEIKKIILHDSFQFEGWTPPMEWSYFGDPVWSGGSILYDRWTSIIKGDIRDIWSVICKIGGRNGWYHANFLWRIYGYFDELIGGVGIRRGRKHPTKLKRGEILDSWRVTSITKHSMILLTSEMKIPGIASLCFKFRRLKNGYIIFDQIACYVPKGLLGAFYGKLVIPFRYYVFKGMINAIMKQTDCEFVYGPKYLERTERVQNYRA